MAARSMVAHPAIHMVRHYTLIKIEQHGWDTSEFTAVDIYYCEHFGASLCYVSVDNDCCHLQT